MVAMMDDNLVDSKDDPMVGQLVAEWVEEMAEWRDDKKAGERAERKVLMKVL